MRRSFLFLLCALASGCVSVAPMPDPRGALKPGQRLVVAVYQAPGPWIVDAADSKAEAAAKISPVGFLMQTVQDEHVLHVSKDLQQYLPRPHYGAEFQADLLQELKSRAPGPVQTGLEAGIVAAQLADWNKAKDQLDWRQRYYAPDPDAPAPRDYAKILTLDDALILDVNLSFGTAASEDGRLLPEMSAASRVYRGDTAHLIWEHEDEVMDQTSSSTLVEFKLSPADLTTRIQALEPKLAAAVAASMTKSFAFAPPVVAASTGAAAGAPGGGNARPFGGGGGLVPMSVFQNPPAASTSAAVSPSVSTDSAAGPSVQPVIWSAPASSAPAPAPPAAPPASSTAPAPSSP